MKPKRIEWDRHATAFASMDRPDSLNRVLGDPIFFELIGNAAGKKILDVGCGTGALLGKFRDQGAEVCGIDGSAELLALSRMALPGSSFEQVDLEHPPARLNSGPFHGVTCGWTLPFVKNLPGCLEFFSRQLLPGGDLVVGMQHPLLPLMEASILGRGPRHLPVFGGFDSYFVDDEGQFHSRLFSAEFHFRSVSSYLNAFTDAGFTLERTIEPDLSHFPDEKLGPYADLKACPIALILKLKKGKQL